MSGPIFINDRGPLRLRQEDTSLDSQSAEPKKGLSVSLLPSCHFTFENLSVEKPDVFLGCQSTIECCESATRNIILSKERHRYATGMKSTATVGIYILAQHSEANIRLSYFLRCLS